MNLILPTTDDSMFSISLQRNEPFVPAAENISGVAVIQGTSVHYGWENPSNLQQTISSSCLYNTPYLSYMGQLAGKQFCRKAPRSAARHQADYGPATPDGKKNNNILGCIRRSAASWCRKQVLPLLTVPRDMEILESSNEPLRRQRD